MVQYVGGIALNYVGRLRATRREYVARVFFYGVRALKRSLGIYDEKFKFLTSFFFFP